MAYDVNENRRQTIRNKEYWTTAETSFYLTDVKGINTTETTLRTLVSRGQGPKFFKIGRQVRYTQETVDAWLSDRISPAKSNSMDGGYYGK